MIPDSDVQDVAGAELVIEHGLLGGITHLAATFDLAAGGFAAFLARPGSGPALFDDQFGIDRLDLDVGRHEFVVLLCRQSDR